MAFLRQEARVIERFRIIEVTEAARRFGCSRTTVYELIARYQEGGLRGLMNRPRGPQEPIPEEVVELPVTPLKSSCCGQGTRAIIQGPAACVDWQRRRVSCDWHVAVPSEAGRLAYDPNHH